MAGGRSPLSAPSSPESWCFTTRPPAQRGGRCQDLRLCHLVAAGEHERALRDLRGHYVLHVARAPLGRSLLVRGQGAAQAAERALSSPRGSDSAPSSTEAARAVGRTASTARRRRRASSAAGRRAVFSSTESRWRPRGTYDHGGVDGCRFVDRSRGFRPRSFRVCICRR